MNNCQSQTGSVLIYAALYRNMFRIFSKAQNLLSCPQESVTGPSTEQLLANVLNSYWPMY